MKPTLKDVAALSGLSTATVSKFLNGVALKPRNAQAVQEAVDRLGYQKNEAARSLRTNRSHLVGVLVPGIDNPFHSWITLAVERTLSTRGYSTIISHYHLEERDEGSRIDFLLGKGVDGILYLPFRPDEGAEAARRVAQRVPLVLVDSPIEGISCDTVMLDNVGAARTATNLLLDQGHRRIGILLGPPGQVSARERRQGYLQATESRGIPPDPLLIRSGDYSRESGRRMVQELLSLSSPPTAVFATNYDTSIGALQGADDLSIRIPGQLSLLGFDDFPLAEFLRPRLSLVAQPAGSMGTLAAQLLSERITGRLTDPPRVHRLAGEVRFRETLRDLGDDQPPRD